MDGAAKELPKILRGLVGRTGILNEVLTGKKSIFDFMSELGSSLGDGDIIEKIFAALEKFGVYHPKEASLNASFYASLFGSEIVSFGLWKNDVRGFVGDGAWIVELLSKITKAPSFKIDTLRALTLTDNSISVPTPAGIPLAVRLDVVGVFHVKGSVTLAGLHDIPGLLSGTAPKANITAAIAADTMLVYTRVCVYICECEHIEVC